MTMTMKKIFAGCVVGGALTVLSAGNASAYVYYHFGSDYDCQQALATKTEPGWTCNGPDLNTPPDWTTPAG